MTIGDVLAGRWTWGALIWEIHPVILVAVSAFWAGYERGARTALERIRRRDLEAL